MNIWTGLLEALGTILRFFHDITVGLFGDYAWVTAIVLLTVAVRVVLLPLAIRQFHSMQAMQSLRPQMKKIQQRYKTDRGMMRTDPEKYRAQRQKQQEEVMALYKEHNVNPASSCLPLVAQMPIFIALFSVLRSPDVIPELVNAPFPFSATLQQAANQAGPVAIAMLLLMGVTTFVQQKQMMASTTVVADDQALQQQKMMLYVMPVMLTVLGFSLPVGVLVYWVTTNLWQMGQQWFMLREVAAHPGGGPSGSTSASSAGTSTGSRSSSTDAKTDAPRAPSSQNPANAKDRATAKNPASSKKAKGKASGSGKTRGNKNGPTRNGHRPGGPGQLNKQPDETGEKRR